MDGLLAIVLIVAIVFLTPVMAVYVIMSFLSRKNKVQRLTREDERKIQTLTKSAQSLEKRLSALETILENEVPDWRSRIP